LLLSTFFLSFLSLKAEETKEEERKTWQANRDEFKGKLQQTYLESNSSLSRLLTAG
jgi:hypothetical protein